MINLFLTAKEHSSSVSTVLGNSLVIFISFIILLFILMKFAIKPTMSMIEKRQQLISSQIDNANTLKEEAEQNIIKSKETVEQAQDKAKNVLLKAKESSEKIKEDASAQARQEVIQLRQNAQKAMDEEREAMMTQLTSQVAEMSIALATRILKREITESDHQRLIDDFIEGLD